MTRPLARRSVIKAAGAAETPKSTDSSQGSDELLPCGESIRHSFVIGCFVPGAPGSFSRRGPDDPDNDRRQLDYDYDYDCDNDQNHACPA